MPFFAPTRITFANGKAPHPTASPTAKFGKFVLEEQCDSFFSSECDYFATLITFFRIKEHFRPASVHEHDDLMRVLASLAVQPDWSAVECSDD